MTREARRLLRLTFATAIVLALAKAPAPEAESTSRPTWRSGAGTETPSRSATSACKKRRRRKKLRKAKPTPPPAAAPKEASSDLVPSTSFRGPTRIDFDDRLIQGQTNKSGAVYLFDRKETGITSMVKRRKSFLRLTIQTVYDR